MKAFYENRTYSSEIPVSASISNNLDFMAHWHTDIEMIYVCDGHIGVGINSEYRLLKKGEIAVCGSNDIHYYENNGHASTVILLIFRAEMLNSFGYWPENYFPCSIFMDNEYFSAHKADSKVYHDIKAVFEKIVHEMSQKNDLYPRFTELYICELFMTFFRYFPTYYQDSLNTLVGSRDNSDIKPMQKALKYLEENYTQNISLEQISNEANISRYYFSRLFRKTTGMNFNKYLARIRADKAEALIKTTRKPIIEIAYETGFYSVRTFNRTFKELKGITPQSLRRDNPLHK